METVNNNIAAQGIATWKMGLSVGQLDAGAYFTVIIMGALAVILYAKLSWPSSQQSLRFMLYQSFTTSSKYGLAMT